VAFPGEEHTDERDAALARGWHLAIRVALTTSALMVAVGASLYRFVGLGTGPILVLTAVVGLVVGLLLPPARPAWMRHLVSRP